MNYKQCFPLWWVSFRIVNGRLVVILAATTSVAFCRMKLKWGSLKGALANHDGDASENVTKQKA